MLQLVSVENVQKINRNKKKKKAKYFIKMIAF